MSLQPGPQDPADDGSLTPPAGAGPSAPPPEPGWSSPPPPAPEPGWSAPPPPPPPPPGYPAGTAAGGYPPPPAQGYPGSWGTGGPAAPGYPAGGYPGGGYPAAGYAQPRETDGKAVVALILAIASWVICPLITAIAALVLAGQSNRAIDASGGRLEGRSMNTATKWVAWANIVVTVLVGIAVLVFVIFLAAQDPSVFTESTRDTEF